MQTQQQPASRRHQWPVIMTLAEYLDVHEDYRDVWDTERSDWPDWDKVSHLYLGKRTLMREGALWVEGITFVIKEDDSGWYEIHGEKGQHSRQQGLNEALKAASGFVAMPSHHKDHYEAVLRDTGAVAWGYGFCTVSIQLVSALR